MVSTGIVCARYSGVKVVLVLELLSSQAADKNTIKSLSQ